MRVTKYTFDLAKLVLLVGVVLFMVGVLPFTPVTVGVLLLLGSCEASLEWSR